MRRVRRCTPGDRTLQPKNAIENTPLQRRAHSSRTIISNQSTGNELTSTESRLTERRPVVVLRLVKRE
jgi:hypothetical protein